MVLGLDSSTLTTLISVILLLGPLIGVPWAQRVASRRQHEGGRWADAEPYLTKAVRWMPIWYVAHVVLVFFAMQRFGGSTGATSPRLATDADAYGPLSSEPWTEDV
jgi:hypothetical protein